MHKKKRTLVIAQAKNVESTTRRWKNSSALPLGRPHMGTENPGGKRLETI